MRLIAIPALIISVLALYIGFESLFRYIYRKQDKFYFSFFFLSLSIAAYVFCSAALYNASTVRIGAFWQKSQLAIVPVICLFFVWFLRDLLNLSISDSFFYVSGFFSIPFACLAIFTDYVVLSEQANIRKVSLLGIVYNEAQLSILAHSFYVFLFVSMSLFALFVWRAIRSSSSLKYSIFIPVLLVFFAALNDILVGASVYSFIYTVEYAFGILLFSMSGLMNRNFIHLYQKTEALSQNLETEILRRLRTIQEQKQHYQELLNAAPVGIMVFDTNGIIESVNPTLLKMLGSPSEERTKKINLLKDRHLKRYGLTKLFEQCITNGEPVQESLYYTSHFGREIYIQLYLTPLHDSNKKVHRVLAIFDDLTEHKIIEDELKRSRIEALQASKAKSEFISTISHEIRTPLNGIMGMTELLLEGDLVEGQKQFLKTILSASEQLLGIINQILTFSSLDSKTVHIEQEPFSLQELFQELYEVFAPLANQKNIQLKFAFGKNSPDFIIGDKGRLFQIFANLIGNALKFTEKGSVLFRLERVKKQKNMQTLTFTIQDTGIGIPLKSQAYIFRAFTQSDKSISRRFGGTGLGLSIVQKLVDLMGGEVSLESELGKGSKFTFTIQAGIHQKDKESFVNRPEKILKENFAHHYPLSILVAEDNLINQKLLLATLEKLGYKADLAHDGDEAVEMALRQKYQIIFMDIHMPNMDGLEASQKILARLSKEEAPVIIALTADVEESQKSKFFESGMKDYLAKPYRLSAIQEMLKKWAETIL